MKTFKEFCEIIREERAAGRIKVTPDDEFPFTDEGLAIQYTIGALGELKGGFPVTLTHEEIARGIRVFCGDEIYNKFNGGNKEEADHA